MLPDRVSNPGPLTYESDALPIALRGPAQNFLVYRFIIIISSSLHTYWKPQYMFHGWKSKSKSPCVMANFLKYTKFFLKVNG